MKNKLLRRFRFIKKYQMFVWPHFMFKRRKLSIYRYIYPRRLYRFFNRPIESLRLDRPPFKQRLKKHRKTLKHIMHYQIEIINMYYGNIRPLLFKKFYNKSKKRRYKHKPIIGSSFFLDLHTRIDNMLMQLSLVDTMFEAKEYLKKGFIQINLRPCYNCNYNLKVWSDLVNVPGNLKNFFYNKLYIKAFNIYLNNTKRFKLFSKTLANSLPLQIEKKNLSKSVSVEDFNFFDIEELDFHLKSLKDGAKFIYNLSNYVIYNFTFMHFWLFKQPTSKDMRLPFDLKSNIIGGVYHKNGHY